MRYRLACFALALTLAASSFASRSLTAQQSQIPGAIRTGITMVPIDVRVLDRNGRPVTDLEAEDFTILEDGVRQDIQHFSASALRPETPAPDARPAFRSASADGAAGAAPRSQRVFLVVLGRGRLQVPAKGLDGLISLVRERLLPQDQVAVLAYNRATDFSADHERVAHMLERYREANPALETKLASHFSGLQTVYGSREIPDRIQRDIDAVFDDPQAPRFRRLPTARIADERQLREDFRREREVVALAPFADLSEFSRDRFGESGFVESQTRQDLESVYTGIEYLRHLEGEKHLIFVTEGGVFLPRGENDFNLATLASDARVAISTIHTGGVAAPPSPFARNPFRRFGAEPAVPNRSWTEIQKGQTLANIARLTGGLPAQQVYAEKAVERLDVATRFQYLLAYAPSDPDQDGKFRRITVKVNRPGLTVLYRHGYYAREQLVPYDRQQLWQKIELKLKTETLARASTEGFRHTARIPVTARPRYVKAIVYDPATDTLGSAVLIIK
jgi:VWFA-related protein